MKMPWTGKSGMARAAAVLATVLGVSLGLCGANIAIATHASNPAIPYLLGTAYVETAGIFVGAVGLVILGLIAIAKAVSNHFRDKG